MLDQFWEFRTLPVSCVAVYGVGSRQVGSGSRMRNVVRLRRVGQASGAAGYDGSSESSSSSDSESDSNFEDENVVESTESSHETGSSEFEEAEVLDEIEEESDHLEGMNFFSGAFPQASSDSFNYQYGYGNEIWEAMEISSSDVEIIEPPPPEIIEISSDSTVAVNVIDISSPENSPWVPMPVWSPTFTLGGSLDFSLESIGQTSDPYYEYHYSPMPMEFSSTNQEVGTEEMGVDMEVHQETEREVHVMESTQNGMIRTNGTLGGQVEKGNTSGAPVENVQNSQDVPTRGNCNLCGASNHHTRECTRIRSQPDLSVYLICSSCETRGHFVADCPMTNVIRTVPISIVPPVSPARSASSATEGSNLRDLDLSRSPDDRARCG
ncbi:hypothetical protein Rs2_29028 [Raphanus sativus]|nr:hypothetical protein Rs2_29028 [Raphanus sativus]